MKWKTKKVSNLFSSSKKNNVMKEIQRIIYSMVVFKKGQKEALRKS